MLICVLTDSENSLGCMIPTDPDAPIRVSQILQLASALQTSLGQVVFQLLLTLCPL